MSWRYNRKVWEEKRKYVKDNYLDKTINDMVKETGMNKASIYKMRKRMKLKKIQNNPF